MGAQTQHFLLLIEIRASVHIWRPGITTPLRLTFSFTLPFLTALFIHVNTASANPGRMIFISTSDRTPVNNASVGLLGDVFIDGLGLPDGFYYFQVVEGKSQRALKS